MLLVALLLAQNAPYRGSARVESVDVRLDPSNGAIYTDARLEILESWGRPFPEEVVLTRVGGTIDGRTSEALGAAWTLVPGETIALDAHAWKGPYFVVDGLRRGLRSIQPATATKGTVPFVSPEGGRVLFVLGALLALLLLRRAARALLILCALTGVATAYVPWTTDGTPTGARVLWKAGSPSPPWDGATSTLSVRLNTLGFPSPRLPSIADAGAALDNALRTIEDVEGATIRLRRGPDHADPLAHDDGRVDVYFHAGAGLDPFGSDLRGVFALTYARYDAAGALRDADIVLNARDFSWSTSGPQDVELTLLHELLHAVGLRHSPYFGSAVWPVGRVPEAPLIERCLSPDDRAGLRALYPEAPLLGRLTGHARIGATPVQRAVVVASDGDGVPQATTVTLVDGSFDLSVPAGDYALTIHHALNSPFRGEVSFVNATEFRSAGTALASVAAGATVAGIEIQAQAGAPTMTLRERQVRFLAPGSSGILRFTLSPPLALADIADVDLGPGFTASPIAGAGGALDVEYTLSAAAAPGFRSFRLTRADGERLLLPAVHGVSGAGALAVAPAPGNPGPACVAPGSLDVPALALRLAAAGEDARVRRLAFAIDGLAPGPSPLRLRRGADLLDPERLALSVPAGTSLDLLVSLDLPSAAAGDYRVRLAEVVAHGMSYGDILSPSGAAAGGVLTLGDFGAGGLGQFDPAPVPAGGSTASADLLLRGTVNATQGTVGLEVELRPLDVPFSGGTHASATTFASGSEIDIPLSGLPSGTRWHWQARALGTAFAPGPWTPFGAFSVDRSAPSHGLVEQLDHNGRPLPPGGLTRGGASIQAVVSNTLGYATRLEVELEDGARATSPFVAPGTLARVRISGSGARRGRARAASEFGAASPWTEAVDFFSLPPAGSDDSRCQASVVAGAGGGTSLQSTLMKIAFALALLALGACYKPRDWDPEEAREHVPQRPEVAVDYAVETPDGPGLQYMVMNVENSKALTDWLDSRSEAESFQSDWRSKYPTFSSYIVWRKKPESDGRP